mmetsp:Transcript_18576/g.57085  ORF Transcript_18576/g.57085 Transcript_18576/m.57085 type:complete len:348 (+) Transcript_18576:393-1436(+)
MDRKKERKKKHQPPMRIMGRFSLERWAMAAALERPSSPEAPLPPWAKCFLESAAWTASARRWSSWPWRRRSRRDTASSPKRQVLRAPSAVRRTRLQPPQKWCVIDEMMPTRPPSKRHQRVVSLGSSGAMGGNGSVGSSRIVETISSALTRTDSFHSFALNGIHSMKRTSTPVPRKCRTNSASWSSFWPRMTTQFTFTLRPGNARASSMPSRTRSIVLAGLLVNRSNVAGRTESNDTFTLRSPASYSSSTYGLVFFPFARATPFVVMPTLCTPSRDEMASQIRARSGRSVGSPPVSRTFVAPIRAKSRARRSISAVVSSFESSDRGTPSAGMQYVHRKLHRSVSEIRR